MHNPTIGRIVRRRPDEAELDEYRFVPRGFAQISSKKLCVTKMCANVIQHITMESVRCCIYGRVQMVMFRDFTTRKARSHSLVGYVRNLKDGSVEAYAQGKREDLEQWIAKLHRGPFLAHVERVDLQWDASPASDMTQKSFDSFDIVF